MPANPARLRPGKAGGSTLLVMVVPAFDRNLAYAVALGAPALLLGLAALAQRPAGPVCREVAEEAARPTLALLDGPVAPRPACIRVRLRFTQNP